MIKFSKKIIISKIITSLFATLFFIIMFNLSLIDGENSEIIVSNIGLLILIDSLFFVFMAIILSIYSYFYYKSSGYSINNEEIKCQRGVIFKKTSIIKREKINAINTKQSLLSRILHIKSILVDSGSTNTALNAEFFVVLDNDDADKLYKQIKILKDTKSNISTSFEEEVISNYENIVSGKEYSYQFNSKRKLIYSISNILILVITLFILGIIGVSCVLIIDKIYSFESLFSIVLFIVIGFILLSVFTTCVSIISTFFMYHNFKIKKSETSLEISHGLFTKVDNSLEYSKIRGVTIKQNILMRIFGFATIYLNIVGYVQAGNNQNNNNQDTSSSGVLIPLCRIDDVNKYLNDLLGGYLVEKKDIESKSIIPYLTWSNLVLFIIMFISAIVIFLIGLFEKKAFYGFIGVGVIYLISEMFLIVYGILAKKTNGINVSLDKITVYYGSFCKKISVIEKKNIIGIEDVTTPYRRKRGISSYIIHFHNNSALNTFRVECISSSALNQMLNMLNFNQEFVINNLKNNN